MSEQDKSLRIKESQLNHLLHIAGEAVTCQMETESLLKIVRSVATGKTAIPIEVTESIKDLSVMSKKMAEQLVNSLLQLQQIPVNQLFNRFPGMIHETAGKLGKKIKLNIEGEKTLVDKVIVEKLADPLIHIIRNAIDHGIEMPDEREAVGKPEAGSIQLICKGDDRFLFFEIKDDGKGLDLDAIKRKASSLGLFTEAQLDAMPVSEVGKLIFHAGLSTASSVTDLSGRGVGMDVVKRNLDSLDAEINVQTVPGRKTEFTLKIPKFRLVDIIDAIIVKSGDAFYGMPITHISHIASIPKSKVRFVQHQPMLDESDGTINLYSVDEIVKCKNNNAWFHEISDPISVMVLTSKNLKLGLCVDRVLHMQKVVIQKLEGHFSEIQEIFGVARTNQGKLANILNAEYLLERKMGTLDSSKSKRGPKGGDFGDDGEDEFEPKQKQQKLEEFLSSDELEIYDDVLNDIDEHLSHINDDISKIVSEPESGLFNGLFRAVHSIKGSCGMLRLNSLVEVVNKGEDLLALLREERLEPDERLMELLFILSQTLHSAVKDLKSGLVPNQDYRDLIEDFVDYRKQNCSADVVSFATTDIINVTPETQFNLNFLERLNTQKISEFDFSLYEIFLKVSPESGMIQAGIMVLLTKLFNKGFVVSTMPTISVLEFSDEIKGIKVLFATSLTHENVHKIIEEDSFFFESFAVSQVEPSSFTG